MYCPNCGKEIEDSVKICTYCGKSTKQDIKTKVEKYCKNIYYNIKNNKKILIITISSLLISLVFVTGTIFYFNNRQFAIEKDYKSVKLIEVNSMDDMTELQALENLIQQDTDLNNLIKQKHNVILDNAFETFYKNLLLFTGKETEFKAKFYFNDYDKNDTGIKVVIKETNINKNGEEYIISNAIISEPQNNIIKLSYDCEGGYISRINYQYLKDKYSNNLSKSWQDFLNMKLKEIKENKEFTYYCDGYPPKQNILVEYLLNIESFIRKYPDFFFNDELRQDYKEHSSNMLRTDIFDEHNVINKDVKMAYEKFLAKTIDKNNENYTGIKNWYDALKKNKFENTANIYKYLYELSGKQDDKETYERTKAIEDFENLKYNKEIFSQVYQGSKEFCAMKFQNQTANFDLCLKNYLREQGSEYSEIYEIIWDYCTVSYGYEGESKIRNCLNDYIDGKK